MQSLPTSAPHLGEAPAAQQRFEHNYGFTLLGLLANQTTWEVTLPAVDEQPGLPTGIDWYWLCFSHPKTGLVGRLVLLPDGWAFRQGGGLVDNEGLVAWLTWQMQEIGARIRKQNVENVRFLEGKKQEYRTVKQVSKLLSFIGVPLAVVLTWHTGQLVGQPEWSTWAWGSLVVIMPASVAPCLWLYCTYILSRIRQEAQTAEYAEALKAVGKEKAG